VRSGRSCSRYMAQQLEITSLQDWRGTVVFICRKMKSYFFMLYMKKIIWTAVELYKPRDKTMSLCDETHTGHCHRRDGRSQTKHKQTFMLAIYTALLCNNLQPFTINHICSHFLSCYTFHVPGSSLFTRSHQNETVLSATQASMLTLPLYSEILWQK